ncbi:MAG: NAD-dependent epimerase [Syntrophobacteraceae bacterium]|nr:NAD-dependent epimerase [Syntrophobacteraceae bacterium]
MDLQKPALVTGAAGFIGFHLSLKMLRAGWQVVGLDNVNDYYDVRLKRDRLAFLAKFPGFCFHQLDLLDHLGIEDIFTKYSFELVVNMAAQAGVRYSLVNPKAYVQSNIDGFLHLLEACRRTEVKHLVFASSSSVYGGNEKIPFSIHDNVDHPVSLYAATKKANELMAHAYSHLYSIPCTGLRFFTVYGPWGRPDMAPILFTRAILAREPIQIFNDGKMIRDFTYIDDVIDALMRIVARPPAPNPEWNGLAPDPGSSFAPFKLYNIGNNKPAQLMEFISAIEDCLGLKAIKEFLPMQPGDVRATFADIEDTAREFGFHPETPLREGVSLFVDWYRRYYRV